MPIKTPAHLGGHQFITHTDRGALECILARFSIESFLDIGCGPGGMLKLAQEYNLTTQGIDGDVLMKKPNVLIHDFTTGPAPLKRNYDLAWSVEFLEHVSEEYQANYMAAFQRAKYVFVTAAPPGKRGHHHVNCRDSKYWRGVFARYGFVYDGAMTQAIRKASTMRREFAKETGLFFVREV